ncbi:MAG: Fic family protein [Deltaproteobacteria bacterium]|nr:Fic family protein [Deltaproteobacteria bacterium]
MTHYIWQHREWPEFRWNDALLLKPVSECRFQQGKILAKMSSLGFDCEQQAQRDILIEEAITTTAIEGEKLSRESVRSSIARKLGLPSSGLPIDRNADGLIDLLLDATQNHCKPLTSERLFGWHAALFPTGYSGLHKIITGNWRGPAPMQVVSGKAGHEKVHYEAMPYDRVEAEMDCFFRWWQESLGEIDGIIRAAVAHFWFVTIHPFEDGNGRIARALTDMALAQDDKQSMRYYSLSSQINAERDVYYEVLERSQKGTMDITTWLQWFSGCFGRSITSSEKTMALVLDKASFWHRHSQTELTDRQRKVINKLLDSGRKGFVGGLTNRKYVSMVKVSRATATRELQHLQDLGIIKANPAKGRSVSYDLVWD